jgi:hypothetical protein
MGSESAMTVLLAWREISAVSRGIADYMDNIDSFPTRIYGPADRHGVIEWQYILQSVRGLQQLTTFAGWRSDEGDRYLEGWATLTSERGARSLPVRRARLRFFHSQMLEVPSFKTVLDETIARADLMLEAVFPESRFERLDLDDYFDRKFLPQRRQYHG